MDFYRPSSPEGTLDALGNVYRALRAWKFYPKGHPSRKNSITQAHAAMLTMLNGNNLSLVCGRSGFSFPDGEPLKDTTQMSASLSYELFIRRVQKITFLSDLYQEDLLEFLMAITLPPDVIQKAGGIDILMSERGIRTIWVNEFDLSAIKGRRREVESRGVMPRGVDEIETNGMAETTDGTEPAEPRTPALKPEEELQALLTRLGTTTDEDVYLLLLRQSIVCADILKARHELTPLLPMVELLADHANDDGRGENLTECARFGLEQLAAGEEFLSFLLDRMEGSGGVSEEAVLAILSAAGPSAVNLTVEKMGTSENLAARKALAKLIIRMGEPAVPAILAMLGDSRWHIVRNLAAILGEIGSPEAAPELQKCLLHTDVRVCKEAIRSLAKIGGREAESAIVTVLRGSNPLLLPQAITSLGAMKSQLALADLLAIISGKDMFLKTLPQKTDALAAIAMIGDRRVTPQLLNLLDKSHLVARNRWELFKIAVAQCLGKLGDSRALPVLWKMGLKTGELGRVCAAAADAIERAEGDLNGGA